MTAICKFFFYCLPNSLYKSILNKIYFGGLRLLRSSHVEENPGPTASRM